MLKISKFEWKIISAMLVTALGPLLFTFFLVETTIEESMAVGLRDSVLNGLRSGVSLYTETVQNRKKIVRLQVASLAQDPALQDAVSAGRAEAGRPLR